MLGKQAKKLLRPAVIELASVFAFAGISPGTIFLVQIALGLSELKAPIGTAPVPGP